MARLFGKVHLLSLDYYQEVLDIYIQSLAQETDLSGKRELAEQMSDFVEKNMAFFQQPGRLGKLLSTYDQAIQAASQGPRPDSYYWARNILIQQKMKLVMLLKTKAGK